jgi:hypothetical protein
MPEAHNWALNEYEDTTRKEPYGDLGSFIVISEA